MTEAPPVRKLARTDGSDLAYRHRPGGLPTILFLPGYASDMDGAKAVALDEFAAKRGLAMLRFDYSGTGLSGGSFENGTLEGWLDDALMVTDRLTDGPIVLVGSSMGGWIALHLALRRPERVAGLIGIAAAPDFTDWGYGPEEKEALLAQGRIEQPNPYGGEPQVTTTGFWQSGQSMRLLQGPIEISVPVWLIHGDSDEEVPLDISSRLQAQLRSADVQLTIVKGGGHRLSQPHEIGVILDAVQGLLERL